MDRIQKRQAKVPRKRHIEPSMMWDGIIGIYGVTDKALSLQREPIMVGMIPEDIYLD